MCQSSTSKIEDLVSRISAHKIEVRHKNNRNDSKGACTIDELFKSNDNLLHCLSSGLHIYFKLVKEGTCDMRW